MENSFMHKTINKIGKFISLSLSGLCSLDSSNSLSSLTDKEDRKINHCKSTTKFIKLDIKDETILLLGQILNSFFFPFLINRGEEITCT